MDIRFLNETKWCGVMAIEVVDKLYLNMYTLIKFTLFLLCQLGFMSML